MIPLSVVSQGRYEEIIYLPNSDVGIELDEYYKKIKGGYAVFNKDYTFVANSDIVIMSNSTSKPAITEGLNWPQGASIKVINKGKILGKGGKGGRSAEYITDEGSFYHHTSDPKNETYMKPSTPGEDGGVSIHGTRSKPMIVTNYGLIGSGGGGGGGGGNAVYIRRQKIASSYVFISRALGGAGAGGGAPNGKRAPNANTVESYFDNPLFSPHYSGSIYEDVDQAKGFTFGTKGGMIKSYLLGLGPAQYYPADYVTKIYAIVPFYLPDNISYRIGTYTTNAAQRWPGGRTYTHTSNTVYYERRSDNIFKQSQDGSINSGGSSGYGGVGLSGTSDNDELAFTEYFNIDFAKTQGGRGGDIGKNGTAGTRYAPNSIYQKAGTWPGDYLLKGGYEASLGGLAGYFKSGTVVINNVENGVTLGRVPGVRGEEVARSTFKFYYKQTDISSTNPRTSLHDIKIGPVSSEGYKFKPEVNIFTTGRSTAWSGAGGVSPNPTPWPNLTLYHMGELDYGYIFKITLPDEYDARLHDVKFVGDPVTSLNGNVVTVKVPGDFRIITSGGGGYITYDADSMLTISLVHK